MSFDELRQYSEQRMADNWAETAPVAYENVQFEKPAGSPFVNFSVINGEGFTAGLDIGSVPVVRDTGMVSLQVFVPEGTGTKTSRELIDAFVAIFEHKRFNAITTYSANITPVGVRDGWHQTNVTVPLRRFRNV